MFSHFLKVFERVSLKNGTYSIINLSGLVIGITASLLIGLYISYEKSYDTFHAKKNRIYRLRNDRFTNGELNRRWTAGPMSIGSDLKHDFPEVERFVRMSSARRQSYVLQYETKQFKEENILYASEDFFKMFSFPLTKGVDSLVLKKPYTMVISESMAKRYFGDVDPLGKTLVCNEKQHYEISGVFKDLPENTHFRFDALFSFESYWKILGPEETNNLMTNWGWVGTYTYIELRADEDAAALQRKLPAYVEKRMGAQLREWNEWMDFTLQPITSIHLSSGEPDEIAPNGNSRSVQYLMLMALFILIMAWINYINLATARSLERAREVGVRKILGSSRRQLMRQFILESIVFKLLATTLALLLVATLLPFFSAIVNRALDIYLLFTTDMLLVIGGIALIGIVFVSLYPALVLSGYSPLTTLKGLYTSPRGVLLRKGLVTIQFVCSAVLIAATLIAYRQLHFMRTSSTGLQTEQLLVIEGPIIFDEATYRSSFNNFKTSLTAYPGIKAVTVSTDVPGHAVRNINGNVRLVGQDEDKGNVYQGIMASEDFITTYGLSLIAGRNFSGADKDEWNTVLVNETAMRQLGFSDPEKLLGHKIYLWDSEPEVIGVIKDYHHQSLKSNIPPLVVVFDKGITQYFSIRLDAHQSVKDAIAQAEKYYARSFPGNQFHYFFMGDYFDSQYESDIHFAGLINGFMMLVVIIACLGLFGLSSYMVQQRKKEISIRKLLGASVEHITLLVAKDFLIIVVLANIVACPIIFYAMEYWLREFAYRINPGLVSCLAPAVLTIIIAALTVAVQSVKAATTNVASNLKSV